MLKSGLALSGMWPAPGLIMMLSSPDPRNEAKIICAGRSPCHSPLDSPWTIGSSSVEMPCNPKRKLSSGIGAELIMLSWVTCANIIESSRTEPSPHVASSMAPTLWWHPHILFSCDGRTIAATVLQTVEPVDLTFCPPFFVEARWQREHSHWRDA